MELELSLRMEEDGGYWSCDQHRVFAFRGSRNRNGSRWMGRLSAARSPIKVRAGHRTAPHRTAGPRFWEWVGSCGSTGVQSFVVFREMPECAASGRDEGLFKHTTEGGREGEARLVRCREKEGAQLTGLGKDGALLVVPVVCL
ncbi:hypothetical protein EJ06DRAFT_532341 [Trichodelitschia bisporula]|uniref:Uncharacterized protein n=1 Tax=Trichodelitschia bisporula TaxID=703511 RepID=A0A6G1HPN9_9PEZI|nr:hypothetical protein EJ06DRAFT_532341 [Trichodelitschia bisporula]